MPKSPSAESKNMDTNKLVRMVNQIAANCDFGPNKNKSVEVVHDHLTRFWGSPMKTQIVEYYREDGSALSEVAALAVAKLAEEQVGAA